MVVGSDIKDILGKRPEDRTEEEIQQVLFALRTYATFAEYPLNMQVWESIFNIWRQLFLVINFDNVIKKATY